MDDNNKVVIRVFNEERDIEVVMKLEKSCNLGPNNNGISIFTSMMDDPLCRIRLYPVHVMLVAELENNRELVGMVRGCIKCVGTGFRQIHVKFGCILGLRISPSHRRIGIGLKLVQSLEEWMIQNGAHYSFLATEEQNIASTNLFTLKCNYVKLSSLFIYVQSVTSPANEDHDPNQDHITVHKLPIDEAISFYKNHLSTKDIYPTDIEAILRENLNLGTWVCYFKEEMNHEDIISRNNTTQISSWAIFSIWNTCGASKFQLQTSPTSSSSFFPLRFFQAAISHVRNKILPCLRLKMGKCDSIQGPFGFLFVYGLHGGGERKGELMECMWSFVSRVSEGVKNCKAIVTEVGFSDPLREHVSKSGSSSMTCIEDLWYLKKLSGTSDEEDHLSLMRPVGNVFVDPRDF